MKRKSLLFRTVILVLFITNTLVSYSQDVTPSGAFTYTYPIEIPKGTNGITPHLSLLYNSQAGNGIAGKGWNLIGLPTITRDSSYNINWNNSDHFLYNGQRLILGNDGKYHTEIESFDIIEYVNSTYWKVTQKNGYILYFGNTTDSKIEAVGKSQARVWALSKLEDKNGNYYQVKYNEYSATGDYYPQKITYTKGNGLSNYKEIIFDYENRPDKRYIYNPSQLLLTKRLLNIHIYIQGKLFSTTKLNYKDPIDSVSPSMMDSIEIFDSQSNSISNTNFTWRDNQIKLYSKDLMSDPNYQDYVVINWLDFNGDGILDKLCYVEDNYGKYYKVFQYDHAGKYTTINLLRNKDLGYSDDRHWIDFNGDGVLDYICRVGGGSNQFYKVYLFRSNGSYLAIRDSLVGKDLGFSGTRKWLDYNGDGISDFICKVGSGTKLHYKVYLFRSNGSYLSIRDTLVGKDLGYSGTGMWLDYNGDGIIDYLCKVGSGSDLFYRVYLHNSTGGYLLILDLLRGKDLGYSDERYWKDYNGDGILDYICRVGGGSNQFYKIYLFRSNGSYLAIKDSLVGKDIGYSGTRKWLDFNGDGLLDFLCQTDSSGISFYRIYLNGDSSFSTLNLLDNNEDKGYADTRVWSDFDGDGITDYICQRGDHPNRYYRVYKSNNVKKEITSIEASTGAVITPVYKSVVEVNNTILPEDTSSLSRHNNFPRNITTSITIKEGTSNTYSTSYEYYNGKIKTGYRNSLKSLGFEWIKKTNSNGSSVKTYYYQEENNSLFSGAIKRQERFGKDNKLYSANEITYSSNLIQAANSNYKAINSILKTDEYGYTYNGVTYTNWETLKQINDKIKTHVNYQYDSKGNITRIFNEGDLSTKTDDTLTVKELIYNTSKNIAVPRRINVYSYRFDETDFTGLENSNKLAKSTNYHYDNQTFGVVGSKGLISRKQEKSNESDISKHPDIYTNYTYDIYGNLKTVSDKNNNNTTTINYDSKHHSLVKTKVNALGQTVQEYEYDEFMRVLWSKDINGNYTWYSYDEKSRINTVSNGDQYGPDRVLTRTTYSDLEAPYDYPKWVKKEVYTPSEYNSNNYQSFYIYYDNLGNKLQTKTEAQNGWIEVNYSNDIKTGTSKVSEPQVIGNSSYNEYFVWYRPTITYKDSIGRVYKTEYPDGFEEFYIYGLRDKKTLSMGDDGLSTISYEKVEDNVKSTFTYAKGSYTQYDLTTFNTNNWLYRVQTKSAWDKIELTEKSSTDSSSGNTITTTIDSLGRKKQYSDPNMGTWNYEYDSRGNLAKQIDARIINGKPNEIKFEYDELNRLSAKYGADTTYYMYDGKDINDNPTGNHGPDPLGRLTSLTYHYDNYSESYVYDDENNQYSITKTIDGISRTQTVTKDEIGRVVEEITPGNETLYYSYRDDGQLSRVYNGDGNYINNLDYNIMGQIKYFDLGNGISTNYDYDDYKLTDLDIIGIASMDFTYDSFGNITIKTFEDNGTGLSFIEDYEYDEMFRLDYASSTSNLYGNLNYEYDYYNNLKEKNGYSYKYNEQSGKSHAVSEIYDGATLVKSYEYDENGNVTRIEGQSNLLIRAKGSGVVNNPPKMELWLDGEKIKTWVITSTIYEDYNWTGVVPTNATIDIVFPNDNASGGVDTNLFVDYININGSIVQSTSAGVILDKGTSSSSWFDGINFIQGQDALAWSGSLRYPVPTEAQTPIRDIIYDSENRISSIIDNSETIASYRYDDKGQRIKTIEGDVTTYYFFDNYEEVYEKNNEGSNVLQKSTSYYYANNQRIAFKETLADNSTKTFYYHSDHLGSAVRVSDNNGNIVQSVAYTPFGEVAWFSGKDVTHYTYTGQESDLSGLMYYNARYYDPSLGRFLQADTYLDGMNRYTYCGNNPIIYNDPTGHWLHIAVGALVGGIAGGVITAVNGGDAGQIALGALAGAGVGALAALTGGAVIAGTVSGMNAIGATTASIAFTSGSLGGSVTGAIMIGGLSGVNSVASGNDIGSDDFWQDVGNGAVIGATYGGFFGGILGDINGQQRTLLNQEPDSIPGDVDNIDSDGNIVGIDGWTSLSVEESLLHQFDGYNPKIKNGDIPRVYKFINEAGHETCWFNDGSSWRNVNEVAPILGGTYNYRTHKKSVVGHTLFDVIPWILLDNPIKFHNKGSNQYVIS